MEARKEQKRVDDEQQKEAETRRAKDLRKMVRRLINLLLNLRFKKNYNNVFIDLVGMLSKDVFKSGEPTEKVNEFAAKIAVESFYELYDNIYENKSIFNRNSDNILRLSLNVLKGFRFISIAKFAPLIVKVCKGSIKELGELLKDVIDGGNDRVSFAMNQILWCEQFIKENNQKKRISEHRKVNSRLKNVGNVRFLSEMSSSDQIIFINNLKHKNSLFIEVIPFFEAHLSADSSFYSRYDVFKLLKRMGFEMSIHRLNEIITESTEGRRTMIAGVTGGSLPEYSQLTREELKNCLLRIEERIILKVVDLKKGDLKNILFYGVISTAIAYFTIRIYMLFLRSLWIMGDKVGAFVSCIPIIVFTLLIGFFFIQHRDLRKDTDEQIKYACTLLFSNFS